LIGWSDEIITWLVAYYLAIIVFIEAIAHFKTAGIEMPSPGNINISVMWLS